MAGDKDVGHGQRPHGVRRQGAVAQTHHQHRRLPRRQQRRQLSGKAPDALRKKILPPMQVRRQLHGDVPPHRPLQLPRLLRIREMHVRQGVAAALAAPHLQPRSAGEMRRFHLDLRRFQRQIRAQYAHACGHAPFQNTKYCG